MVSQMNPNEITRLLGDMRHGKAETADQLIPLVYDQLRRAARRLLATERVGHTLQPTALVDDVLMQLIGPCPVEWRCRAQFFGLASKMMRNILIDHARAHAAEKRGGDRKRIPLDDQLTYDWRNAESMLALDQALHRLQQYDARLSKTVEMRFFGGMTETEIAEVLDHSVKTVRRDWQFARDWLYREMTDKRDMA